MSKDTRILLGFIALATLMVALLFSCKKDETPNIQTLVIEQEQFAYASGTMTVTGVCSYAGKINGIKMRAGLRKDLSDARLFEADLDKEDFKVAVTGLQAGTEYHYRYEVDYGFAKPFLTEEKTFTTPADAPTVSTLEVMSLDSTTFRVKCEVTADGGLEVSERGICWNTYGDPTLDDETLKHANGGLGQYTLRLENLGLATHYYVRAYAKNATGVGFGEVLEFSTGTATTIPQVSSVEIGEVTATSAVFTGNMASDGGLDLEECGVCWSLNANPTISGSHAAASQAALGVFQVSMTGLTPNKTYHARAYAMNDKGVAYGEDLTFTTTAGLPVVTTSGITEITATSAKGGGNVTDQGASNVTQRGVCWSTSHNPTTSSSHQAASTSGAGSFTVSMTGLTPNATYYVRAYATNAQGTSYGAEVSFTTTIQPNAPTGAINGLFSVSDTEQVWFSQGNLQYKASTNTWRFADNQYDCIGSANSNISSTYSGYIDLFGWGTSGWNNGNTYYHPWDSDDSGGSLYGPPGQYNLTRSYANADWGVYNPISNGGNQSGLWRTLTHEEWTYVFNTRSTNSGIRYAKAKVNNINGVILLPDDWSAYYYALSSINQTGASFNSNLITASQWNTLEQHGAVFLPAAGYRYGTSVNGVGSYGYYWSASYSNSDSAWLVYFLGSYLSTDGNYNRFHGPSVRLVRSAQ